jgi:hypothetical protein
VILAVPAVTPVTTPAELIVAIDVAPDDQVPPATESVSTVVAFTHTVVLPTMVPAVADGLTVTVVVALAVPHTLVME